MDIQHLVNQKSCGKSASIKVGGSTSQLRGFKSTFEAFTSLPQLADSNI
jgi:hypothetical protein